MQRILADKLIDLCERNAEKIAEQWYKAISANPRTTSYRLMSKEGCLHHATFIYKNLGQMYFADNCVKAVAYTLDVHGFIEDNFGRGIPLNELIYALILMRRHIWLFAESEALYNTSEDMVQAIDSINRVLLVFDYIVYLAAHRYEEIASHWSHARGGDIPMAGIDKTIEPGRLEDFIELAKKGKPVKVDVALRKQSLIQKIDSGIVEDHSHDVETYLLIADYAFKVGGRTHKISKVYMFAAALETPEAAHTNVNIANARLQVDYDRLKAADMALSPKFF